MNALITGGAGFIGSHLVDALLQKGWRVTVVDNFSSGREENLSTHLNSNTIKIYRQSINDDLSKIFKEGAFNYVFHLAAIPSVQYSITNPLETHAVNVNGTLNLLEQCRKFKIKRFIFSSSSGIYGTPTILPIPETAKTQPLSPYALQKLISEQYCQQYSELYGLETVCLRYFNVFGPRQNPQGDYASLIPKFINSVLKKTPSNINGDGTHTRDFIYVDDVVLANIIAAEIINNQIFKTPINIGSGIKFSVNDVANLITKVSNKNILATHGPEVVEAKDSLADITLAKQILNWEPKISFENGLQTTFDYFKLL